MRVSTRARYGTRAMVDLALVYPQRAVSVKEMARNEQVSVKYLEQIMAALKAAGLAKSLRGPRGGYSLTRPPEKIKLSDVFRALGGGPELVECVMNPESCPMGSSCPTRPTWVEINQAIVKILDGTTLQDLVKRKAQGVPASPPSYQI